MKILWTVPIDDKPKTGAEKFYAELKRELSKKAGILCAPGIEFITFSKMKKLSEILRVNIHNFRLLLSFGRGALIFQDLLHRRSFVLANALLRFLFGRKVVIFVHQEYADLAKTSFKGKIILRVMYFLFFSTAHKIIANSKATAKWVSQFGSFSKKIFVYYPVLKSVPDAKNAPQISNRRDSGINLLCVANIRENKGQKYLIEALGMLERKDITLDLVGDVKEEAYYKSLFGKIKDAGLENRIRFRGFLNGEELAGVYKHADIFVLPTLLEGFGMVLIEAMFYSLPIVASNVGGIPEIIQDGADGLLVPPASAKDLANAIEKLIKDRELRERLGMGAFRKYRQLPSRERSFENFCTSCLML